MLLSDVAKVLDANVFACGDKLYREVVSACGSDLMSDVLAFSDCKEKAVLLTGLLNQQVIRTAEMMDFKAVIFVRGKTPTEEIREMANEREIVVFNTEHSLFSACGLLYSNGLKGDIHK
ncbi:MAG: hypothetical protein LBV08_10130 [Clostridiales bacterium]|jgi:predicted transcriptional regulator|nr:hypothetical protein [Clostridiales bacterium]